MVDQLALAFGQHLPVGALHDETQRHPRRVDVLDDADVLHRRAHDGFVPARAVDVGDGDVHRLAARQALAGFIPQVPRQVDDPRALFGLPAVATELDLAELCGIGPLDADRATVGGQTAWNVRVGDVLRPRLAGQRGGQRDEGSEQQGGGFHERSSAGNHGDCAPGRKPAATSPTGRLTEGSGRDSVRGLRMRSTSRSGGAPNMRLYSRLNWEGLS